MRTYLLWERFLAYWLPESERTGTVAHDIDRALRRTYTPPGATFAQKGGPSTVVITGQHTAVASKVPPRAVPPAWLAHGSALRGRARSRWLFESVRALLVRPRPHVILVTGRTPFALEDIVVGQGTVVVVNAPGGRATFTDAVRIARVRRALRVLGSVARARRARALIEARIEAMGHCMALDCRIEALIAQLGVAPEAFFDAVDLARGGERARDGARG